MFNLFKRKSTKVVEKKAQGCVTSTSVPLKQKMIEYKEEGKPSEIQECVTSAPKFEISVLGKQEFKWTIKDFSELFKIDNAVNSSIFTVYRSDSPDAEHFLLQVESCKSFSDWKFSVSVFKSSPGCVSAKVQLKTLLPEMRFCDNYSEKIFEIDEFEGQKIVCGYLKDDKVKRPEEMTIVVELSILNVVSY